MQRTNHWFVAYERAAELRIGGWNAGGRLRAGAKHLCGQTCLHKLVDDFMMHRACPTEPAKADANLPEQTKPSEKAAAPIATDAMRKSVGAKLVPDLYIDDFHSSARLIPAVVAESVPVTEIPNYKSANWRIAAWQRERERERGIERVGPAATRRNSA